MTFILKNRLGSLTILKRYFLGLSCAFHVPFMRLSCAFHVPFMGLSCAFHGPFCAFHGPFMGLSWAFHVPFMCLSWAFHGPFMGLSWAFHGPFMGLWCAFHGPFMGHNFHLKFFFTVLSHLLPVILFIFKNFAYQNVAAWKVSVGEKKLTKISWLSYDFKKILYIIFSTIYVERAQIFLVFISMIMI